MSHIKPERHRAVVLALDGVKPFDLGIPAQVLGQATDSRGEPLYDVSTCSLGGRPVRTCHDFTVIVAHDETELMRADTVIIATQDHTGELPHPGGLAPALADAVANLPTTTRIVSLCTSAFVLAAAGLLDRLSATTHWGISDEFARRFPQVDVDPSVLFVDNGRVLTSAGAAAGIDLCLHLIRRDFGAQVANETARRCVVAPWREGGQAQFIHQPVPVDVGRSTAPTREWSLERLAEPLTLPDLARHARMSTRSFTRHFRREVGQSPQRWLTRQRIDRARQLLESTDLTVSQIANAAGFVDAVALRRHLHRHIGLTPKAYREAYSASLC
ncbi:helix-turn-helix domain-containing protein [Actinoplanes sp. NPDC089786]|uniref:GlxA family transcriptional regulator n=1 Tax=Actinoplanes sp. NPDC089786 TaxID=3155185 RepID=UPI0034290E0F